MGRSIKSIQRPLNGVQYVVSRQLREKLKPIVFFDSGGAIMDRPELLIDFHPHSGVGILTYVPFSELHHQDSGGNDGIVAEGGAQWMLAGQGIWHRESYRPGPNALAGEPWRMFIHQLWVQLPPELEEADVEYRSLQPAEIPRTGQVKVLIGEYEGVRGGIQVPLDMSYLDVHLEAGEVWTWHPPASQTRGFVYPRSSPGEPGESSIRVGETTVSENSIGILDEEPGKLEVTAPAPVNFVLIVAEPSEYPIVAAHGSMHTNRESLNRSKLRIDRLGRELARNVHENQGAARDSR